jgi:chromosome segregation ATPase
MRRKLSAVILVSWTLAQSSFATGIPVIDVAHILSDNIHQVLNYAQYLETQANTLRQYETQVTEIARLGDLSQLRNLPGVSEVGQLYSDYQQLQNSYQQLQGAYDPRNFQVDVNSILSSYKNPNLNVLLSSGSVSMNQGNYQFGTQQYKEVDIYEQQLKQLESRRQALQQQRDAAFQGAQGAATDAAMKQYQASINALNGALADVNAEANEIAQRASLKSQQIFAAKQVYQEAIKDGNATVFSQSVQSQLNQMPNSNYGKPAYWGNGQ